MLKLGRYPPQKKSSRATLTCVARVSARVGRESWDENKNEEFIFLSLQLSRNQLIEKACSRRLVRSKQQVLGQEVQADVCYLP